MRFSLLNLFLLLASWPVAFFLAPLVHKATMRANGMRYSHTVTEELVDQWVTAASSRKTRPDKKADVFGIELFSKPERPGPDSWGRPLQFPANHLGELKYVNGVLMLYSLGADGDSKTAGNDPDDINSWNDKHLAYYEPIISKIQTEKSIWNTIWITPAIYILFLFGVRSFRNWSKREITGR